MTRDVRTAPLSWQEGLAIVLRRRWYLLGPFFALGLLGFGLARVWPVRYRSEALILVEGAQVPAQYVTPNVVMDMEDRLQTMTDQILSRSRLQRLIEQFGLYSQPRAHFATDDLIDRMRKEITVEPVKASAQTGEPTAFRISYLAPSRETAQQVVSELTALFIDENARARNQQSVGTTNFLANQLEDARQGLARAEQRRREYKMQYLGELPEQEQSNLQILTGLQAQLSAASTELDRVEQDKTYLESMRAEYQSLGPAVHPTPTPGGTPPETLPELRAKLADLQARYTDRYPEIIQTKSEIARLEKLQQQQKSSASAGSPKPPGGTIAGEDNAQPKLMEMDSRLNALRLDIENRRKQIELLRQRMQAVQAHLNLTPVREEQLAEVTRDYQDAKERYESLRQKESQSELATNLEKRQQGEQFRVIDPASLPEKPVEPNRAEIILGGWLVGLLAGIGLTAVKETSDTHLQGKADVETVTALPLLVSVPLLCTPWEQGQVRRHYWMEALAAALLVAISLGLGVCFWG
jgi:polysaccharide biosynthesis transport protein